MDPRILTVILVDSYNTGWNIERIAEDLGITCAYAYRLIQASDERIAPGERDQRMKRWELAEAVRRYARGEAVSDIADAISRDPQTARARLRSAGIDPLRARVRRLESLPAATAGELRAFLRTRKFTAIPVQACIDHGDQVVHAKITAAAFCEDKNGKRSIQLLGTVWCP